MPDIIKWSTSPDRQLAGTSTVAAVQDQATAFTQAAKLRTLKRSASPDRLCPPALRVKQEPEDVVFVGQGSQQRPTRRSVARNAPSVTLPPRPQAAAPNTARPDAAGPPETAQQAPAPQANSQTAPIPNFLGRMPDMGAQVAHPSIQAGPRQGYAYNHPSQDLTVAAMIERARDALRFHMQTGDVPGLVKVHHYLAGVLTGAEAIVHARHAVRLSYPPCGLIRQSDAHYSLAQLLTGPEAVGHARKALRFYKRGGDVIGQGNAHNLLARHLTGAEAIGHARDALRLSTQAGDVRGQGTAHNHLAQLLTGAEVIFHATEALNCRPLNLSAQAQAELHRRVIAVSADIIAHHRAELATMGQPAT